MLKGKFTTKINKKEYEITKEHAQLKQNGKEPYGVKVLNFGIILINSKLDKELLKEGFSREFIRWPLDFTANAHSNQCIVIITTRQYCTSI